MTDSKSTDTVNVKKEFSVLVQTAKKAGKTKTSESSDRTSL